MPLLLWRWTKRKCTKTVIQICIQMMLISLATAEGPRADNGNVVDAMGKAPPPPEGLRKDEEGRVLMGVKHVGCDDGTVSFFFVY